MAQTNDADADVQDVSSSQAIWPLPPRKHSSSPHWPSTLSLPTRSRSTHTTASLRTSLRHTSPSPTPSLHRATTNSTRHSVSSSRRPARPPRALDHSSRRRPQRHWATTRSSAATRRGRATRQVSSWDPRASPRSSRSCAGQTWAGCTSGLRRVMISRPRPPFPSPCQ
jgi:hypothetical protein